MQILSTIHKNWRLILVSFVTLLSLNFFAANFVENKPKWMPSSKTNLGLDLKGGSHILLHVNTKAFFKDQLALVELQLKKELRKSKISFSKFRSDENSIILTLTNSSDHSKVTELLKNINSDLIGSTPAGGEYKVSFSDHAMSNIESRVVDRSIEIVRMRVDETGTKEPVIQRQGANNILLQVPGVEDPTSLKNILGKTAKLSFNLIDTNGGQKIILTGDQLTDARISFNEMHQPVVEFTLNSLGARIFGEVTRNNIGRAIAIVLDGNIISAPQISVPILGGRGVITGNFTLDSANELALLLRAGALPAPLEIIEERTIGPNLGMDSINHGRKAGIIGFSAVVIFMLLTYGILGVFANIALILNLLYLGAMLSAFNCTLTLPGIAGIILTIGMAVDANVLIYERIREELKTKVSIPIAIKKGFESAFTTILDSNITTLIAASLMYYYGTGAIKGFAVTLTFGIIASMFAAIMVTKTIIDYWVSIYKPQKLNI